MSFNKLAQGNAHLLLDRHRIVDVAADAEKLRTRVLVTTKAVEPSGAATHDCRDHSDGLHICDRRGAPVQARVCWEGRLQTRATGLSLERLDEGSLLTADICAGATMHYDIEVEATVAGVFAQQALCVGLVDSALKLDLLVPELTANINVGSLGTHAEANDKSALDQLVRVVSQNLAVLAGAWLRLISVDH